jgi:NAD(P)H-quinone oxidoreductase subunit 4
MATGDIYSSSFRTMTVFLAAVGLILTPIYLLAMLRQVFYGASAICDVAPVCDLNDRDLKAQGDQEAVCFGTDCVLPEEAEFKDANSREIFIAFCFLGLIMAIGVYPQLATQMYDTKTVALNTQMRQSYRQTFHPLLSSQVAESPMPAA